MSLSERERRELAVIEETLERDSVELAANLRTMSLPQRAHSLLLTGVLIAALLLAGLITASAASPDAASPSPSSDSAPCAPTGHTTTETVEIALQDAGGQARLNCP